ncbi:hypothetical protein BX666DRAFT_2027394 [Dichotomocladium elegans]|nr:hypothetical protein BX666DRAFT_2027394 [Dichotomocladium elegans]
METQLLNTLGTIANREGVKGVLLADEMGLCLGAKGIATSDAAAFAASIARTARDLLPPASEPLDKAQYPTIRLDYEHT